METCTIKVITSIDNIIVIITDKSEMKVEIVYVFSSENLWNYLIKTSLIKV